MSAKTTKVTLKVAMSEADLGKAAAAGDTVEVDADTAARWVVAGIAETGGGDAAAEPPADAEPPSVPRRALRRET